jgi:hypothetical protein
MIGVVWTRDISSASLVFRLLQQDIALGFQRSVVCIRISVLQLLKIFLIQRDDLCQRFVKFRLILRLRLLRLDHQCCVDGNKSRRNRQDERDNSRIFFEVIQLALWLVELFLQIGRRFGQPADCRDHFIMCHEGTPV